MWPMGVSASQHVAGMADLRARLTNLDSKLTTLNDARFWRQAAHVATRSDQHLSLYGDLLACNPGAPAARGCILNLGV